MKINELRLIIFSIALAVGFEAASGVSGISVCTHNGSGSVQYYGTKNGELLRLVINNNTVTKSVLTQGPCSNPKICPSGKMVAFVHNSQIAVIDMKGGTITTLVPCYSNSQIDFPNETWVYFTGGDFHSSNKTLKRVNVSTKVVETVVTFQWRTAQFHISNDLTRVVMRPGDNDGIVTGTIITYDMPGNGSKFTIVGGAGWSCASGLSSDGQYLMDGDPDPHESMVIRRYDGTQVMSYTNKDALSWPPNNNSYKPSSYNHAIFHSSMATNDPNWVCIAIGGGRDYVWDCQALINWKDRQCIVPTAGIGGKFDHGDFWVGDPATILGTEVVAPSSNRYGATTSTVCRINAGQSAYVNIDRAGSYVVADLRGAIIWAGTVSPSSRVKLPAAKSNSLSFLQIRSKY